MENPNEEEQKEINKTNSELSGTPDFQDDNEEYEEEPEELEEDGSDNAVNLRWTIGCNKDIVQGVHDLTDENRSVLFKKEIFYSSAHTGVIYDYEHKEQILLRAHVSN